MLAISVRIAIKAGQLLIERGKNQKVLFIRQSSSGLKSKCLELLNLTYHSVSVLSRMQLAQCHHKGREQYLFVMSLFSGLNRVDYVDWPHTEGIVFGNSAKSISREETHLHGSGFRLMTPRSNKRADGGPKLEVISKIVDHAQGRDANRFKNGAYTIVFEYFESVCNNALGC